MPEKSKHCCEEHVDIAFDDFLVEYELFPHMEDADGEKCSYCNHVASYVLILPSI